MDSQFICTLGMKGHNIRYLLLAILVAKKGLELVRLEMEILPLCAPLSPAR